MPPIDPNEIDRRETARRLDNFNDAKDLAAKAHVKLLSLVAARIAVAKDLQNQIGSDVVILYKGQAYIPHARADGDRQGYEVLPVYDLDAALIEQDFETDVRNSFRDLMPGPGRD